MLLFVVGEDGGDDRGGDTNEGGDIIEGGDTMVGGDVNRGYGWPMTLGSGKGGRGKYCKGWEGGR